MSEGHMEGRLEARMDQLFEEFRNLERTVLVKLGELASLVSTEADRCPYREIIARASNNIARLQRLEDLIDTRVSRSELEDVRRDIDDNRKGVEANRLEITKIAVRSGMAGGSVVGAILTLGALASKMLGWW